MKFSRVAAVLVLVLTAGCRDKARDAEPAHEHGSAPAAAGSAATPGAAAADAGPPPNVVQTEMRMLTEILQHTVRGIGVGDVRPIEHELHALHEAKEATEAAVKSGAYKLPKNADKLEQFEAMDEAFHEQLGALVTASDKNDVPAAATALGNLVQACAGCHAAFRP
jgi:cytochrome c556